jgi:hypothetical protein
MSMTLRLREHPVRSATGRARWALTALALASGCGTLGDERGGDEDLPTAGAGPFRPLDAEEVKGLAPFVLEDPEALYRDPAVLRDGEATLLYAVARVEGREVIVRTRALDERTFFGTSFHFGHEPAVVLVPDAPWEGTLSGPALLRVGGEVLLYYAGAEGIGVARSSDGLAFRKEPGPAFRRDPSAGSWETTPPRAPTVFALPDGRTLRMLYAAGAAIGEAESVDGVHWRRLGSTPVLGPSAPPAPSSLLPNEKPPFDTVAVGDPCVVTRTTPAGRFHVRVLYTGTGADGATAIGFAARYGESGPLDRQTVPAYSVGLHEAAPALLDLGARSLLYLEQERRDGNRPSYPAIAAAVAPGSAKLSPPRDFPEQP